MPGLPAAQQAEISQAVRLSGGSAIVELRERPGSEAIVEASSQALASSAATVAFTAAGFVLFGLCITPGLPNPRGGAADAQTEEERRPVAAAGAA